MNIPKDLKYTKNHEWLRIEGSEAFVGITDFAQGELGDIVFVEVETVGDEIAQGETFGTIEAVKTVSDMFMPVNGEVSEFNQKLEDTPELINSDPYGEGWIIKVKLKDASEADSLLSDSEYASMINS